MIVGLYKVGCICLYTNMQSYLITKYLSTHSYNDSYRIHKDIVKYVNFRVSHEYCSYTLSHPKDFDHTNKQLFEYIS